MIAQPVGVPRRSRLPVVVLSLIGVIVLLAVGAYVFTRLPLGEQVHALMLPKELQGAQFVSSSPKGTVVYEHTGSKYQPRMQFAGVVDSVVETAEGYAGLKRSVTGDGVHLVAMQEVVAESASARSLSASPDGRRIAYAETSDGSVYAKDPSQWLVKVYYPDPGTTQTVGAGFAPFFLSDTTLGWFTALGAYQMNLEQGTVTALLSESFTQPFEGVMVSPNRTIVARVATDGVHVYRIDGTTMTLIDTYRLEGTNSYALGNDALYAIRGTADGAAIWRQGFDGSLRQITVMPATLGVTGLILSNH